jgi:predicted dehydrogenase
MRFAVIGCGMIATTHVRALQSLGGGVEVVACVDVVPDRAEGLGRSFGLRPRTLDAVLADPKIDALTICTPSGLHAELGVAGLLADKHVLVEKPMDISVAACDRLLNAKAQSGCVLGVISQRRFDRAAQRVKAAVDSGELGPIIHADCRVPWYRSQSYYDSGDWRGTWELDGGGCLMNQGVHSIDILRWLCGPPATAYAQSRTAAHVGIDVEDVICATVTFESGAIATVTASTSTYPAFPARIAIQGSSGGAVIEGDSLAAFAVHGGQHVVGEAPLPHAIEIATGGTRAATLPVGAVHVADDSVVDPWTDGHRRQFLDFVEAVRTGRRPLVDGSEGRNAVELIEMLYSSARTGEVVRRS